jgi:pimeloyl-ACP methyl ester carboxylesterase
MAVAAISASGSAQAEPVTSVVLVHGGFVDGSGWADVYQILKKDGYKVTVVQHPTNSLADDVTVTKRAIAASDGKVILVGHSYGGAVITEAGNDPKVANVVYIAAFAPDKGESIVSLLANPALGEPVPPILPPVQGYLFLDKAKFASSFADDLKPELASFMAESRLPFGVDAAGGVVITPAWRTKKSWYLVASDDKMIPPAVQRRMATRAGSTVREVVASHSLYISQPASVARIIEEAAKGAE